jgi:hypothetical protein
LKISRCNIAIANSFYFLDGYASPDEAIAKLIDLGYKPELRYQLNPNWLAICDPDDPRCLVKSEDIEPIPLPTAVS